MLHILQVNQLTKAVNLPTIPWFVDNRMEVDTRSSGDPSLFSTTLVNATGCPQSNSKRDYTRKRTVPMETTENMFTVCSDMWHLSSILSSEISNIYAIDQFQVMWHNKSRCRGPWHITSHSTETSLASVSSVLLTHVHREESPGGPHQQRFCFQ